MRARAGALKLHGLLAHWDELGATEWPWINQWLAWEEQERQRRGLDARLRKAQDVAQLGPVAQEFKAAFYPGRDDKSISTLEFDGVELAAIQGLHSLVKEKDAKITALEQRLADLEAKLNKLVK